MTLKKTSAVVGDLDEIDILILDLLQHDARVTTKEVANKLGLTITPVAVRIRKLEGEGYIQRYVAILNKEKIERSLIAFTSIQLREHTQAALRNFEQKITRFPEVMECFRLAGQMDFLAKVAVRDMAQYDRFLMDRLSLLPDIGSVQTQFVLSDVKVHTAYSLRALP
jgi:Lrp/AsnC family leucine-responsive transcriptional regulator